MVRVEKKREAAEGGFRFPAARPMILTRDPFNAFLDRPAVVVPGAADGRLAGLRLAVKDIFDVKGWKTGCGNPQKLAQAAPAGANAPAVQRLLDAGAAFAGKTQTDELAFSLFGQNGHFPRPVNPKAPERITGGSSSGSAAAVAAGLADIALGSDTGGSVRAPASFCGLWGLRPTHGSLPLGGVMPLAPSLDTVGFFARDAETLGRAAAVLFDAAVAEGGPRRLLRFPLLDGLVRGEAQENYRRAAERVEAALGGAAAEEPPAFDAGELYWCFRRIQGFEAWAAHGAWLLTADRGLGPGVRERFAAGSEVSGESYAAETQTRGKFRAALAERLGADGVLLLPTVPGPAPLVQSSADALNDYRAQALTLLCWAGLSGFPQLNLPLGDVAGAPFGISLLGPAGSDLRLIALGRRVARG
jgi:amidase